MSDYTVQQIDDLDTDVTAAQLALSSNDVTGALSDVKSFYNAQTSYRGYASDALQVVNDTDLFGLVANQELIDALGQTIYAKTIPIVAVQLAVADVTLIDQGAHTIPTENQIADYHFDVYKFLKIDSTYWGGSTTASLGLDWSQGTLKPKEQDNDLTDNIFYRNADLVNI